MNDKDRNMVVRIVSGLTLLPLVVYLVYRGGWYMGALVAVAAAVCAAEYYLITMKRWTVATVVGVAMTAVLPVLPVFKPGHASDIGFWWLGAFFFFAWAYGLLFGKLADAPTHAAHAITGMLYGALGMTAVMELRQHTDGFHWTVCAMTITWANDTCAYFAGRFLGRHKLYPEVSPNKTWEGFFGGMAGSVIGLFIYRAFWFPGLTVFDCLGIGIAGGITGPIGDLCESMLKRSYGVKDSGKIIPGHGGVLDRIDALLFNAPVVFVYVQFLRDLF